MDPGNLGEDFPLAVVRRMRKGDLELTPGEIDYARALYDGDLLATDRHVGKLLSLVEDLGLHDRTLVVVTSDHGEGAAAVARLPRLAETGTVHRGLPPCAVEGPKS